MSSHEAGPCRAVRPGFWNDGTAVSEYVPGVVGGAAVGTAGTGTHASAKTFKPISFAAG